MAKLKPLFELDFEIVSETPCKVVKCGTVQVIADDETEAEDSVRLFLASHDPAFTNHTDTPIRFSSVRQLLFDEPRKALLVLIGGTSEADVMMLSPKAKFPPGTVVVRESEHYREIAYVATWADDTHWTGFRWHEQRSRWVPIPQASAAEIVGEALRVATGHLRLIAAKAMKNLPKG